MVRFTDDGDEVADEHLAPVTPLFRRGPTPRTATSPRHVGNRPTTDASDGWDRTWTSEPAGPAHLRGGATPRSRAAEASIDAAADADEANSAAEKHLLRKLRGKPLSIAEARAVLDGFDLTDDGAQAIIDDACRRGYLDDAALAEHLIHVAVDRKGQGRTAIALALQKRRIPRDVVDTALQALPDDDVDRAWEFARTKVRQLDRVEPDVALRRLVGQLSRRGYTGSIAMDAARGALDEHRRGGVRFS